MPHLGAGYTGIMFTLSPVITLVLSLVLGVRRPNPLGIAGIVAGFVGALMVASTRGEAGRPLTYLGRRRASHSCQPCRRQYLPHCGLARTNRTDRACLRQPSRGGGHSARRDRGIAGDRRFCTTRGRAAARRRAGRLRVGDVRVLLPAAGRRRASLSQPDRLRRGGCRVDRRRCCSSASVTNC